MGGYRSGMRSLVVMLTTVDPEPCSMAFTVAATALAAGARVSVWLTGEATRVATPGYAEEFALPFAAPLPTLLQAVLADGTLTVCTQCARRRDLTQADFLPGTRVAGAATYVDEILEDGAQSVVHGSGTLC